MSSEHHVGQIHQTCVLRKNLLSCKKRSVISKRVRFLQRMYILKTSKLLGEEWRKKSCRVFPQSELRCSPLVSARPRAQCCARFFLCFTPMSLLWRHTVYSLSLFTTLCILNIFSTWDLGWFLFSCFTRLHISDHTWQSLLRKLHKLGLNFGFYSHCRKRKKKPHA